MKRKLLYSLLAMITACGGGGNQQIAPERPVGNAEGVALHGPVRNATISAYDWATGQKGEFVSSTQSNSEGEYILEVQALSGPLLIVSTGGDYNEESSSRSVDMGADELKAIISYELGKDIEVQLTFFTSIAACLAERFVEEGKNIGTAVVQANEVITAYAGVPITQIRPIDVTKDTSFTLNETQQHRYGMVIAGISEALEQLRIKDGAPESSTIYTSKYLTNVACDDIREDGLLNGIGTITSGNPTGQLNIGSLGLSYDFYRTSLGKGVLDFTGNSNNKTGLTATQMLDTANAISQANYSIFGATEGQPVDTRGPVITFPFPENELLAGEVELVFDIIDAIGFGDKEALLYVDDELLATAPANNPVFNLDTTVYQDGEHDIRIVVEDILGNASEKELTYEFINTGSALTLTSDTLVNNTDYVARGNFVDNGAEIDRIEVDGVIANINRTEMKWNVDLELIGGTNQLEAIVYDELGNITEQEFRVDVDLIFPSLEVLPSSARFTNFDGSFNSCEIDNLTDQNGITRPVCLSTENISLNGREIGINLDNDNYIVFSADINDPQGAGVYTDTADLLVEYKYLLGETIIVDWSPVIRPNRNLRFIYFPMVTEFLGEDFYLTDINTVHTIELRLTDNAGNAVKRDYQTKLDVITPAAQATANLTNESIFYINFAQRSGLNGAEYIISYDLQESSVPYLINVEPSENHQASRSYEGVQRFNRARTLTTYEWRGREYLGYIGNRRDPEDWLWSDFKPLTEVVKKQNFYSNSGEYFYPPAQERTDYTAVYQNIVSPPIPGVWQNIGERFGVILYAPGCEGSAGVYTNLNGTSAAYHSDNDQEYDSCIDTKETEVITVEERIFYSMEYEPGYPRNEFSDYMSQHNAFQASKVKVINNTIGLEIFPDQGWYRIPKDASVVIEKSVTLPIINHYTDTRVSLNSSDVPYNQAVFEYTQVTYELDTNITITRSIDPGTEGGSVSEISSVHGIGIQSYILN